VNIRLQHQLLNSQAASSNRELLWRPEKISAGVWSTLRTPFNSLLGIVTQPELIASSRPGDRVYTPDWTVHCERGYRGNMRVSRYTPPSASVTKPDGTS
jgi:hypothetical protein